MTAATPWFETPPLALEPAWIDWNGHLNMAYYNVLFDRAADLFLAGVGISPAYVTERAGSIMTAEIHVRYVREIFLEAPVRVRIRVVGLDDKRLHLFSELIHADEGWVSATSEQMNLHVDMTARRVAPWPADIRERLEVWAAASRAAPAPDGLGRAIAMRAYTPV